MTHKEQAKELRKAIEDSANSCRYYWDTYKQLRATMLGHRARGAFALAIYVATNMTQIQRHYSRHNRDRHIYAKRLASVLRRMKQYA